MDADETRRRREDETVQIRKQKRDEQLAKKRLFNPEAPRREGMDMRVPEDARRKARICSSFFFYLAVSTIPSSGAFRRRIARTVRMSRRR